MAFYLLLEKKKKKVGFVFTNYLNFATIDGKTCIHFPASLYLKNKKGNEAICISEYWSRRAEICAGRSVVGCE